MSDRVEAVGDAIAAKAIEIRLGVFSKEIRSSLATAALAAIGGGEVALQEAQETIAAQNTELDQYMKRIRELKAVVEAYPEWVETSSHYSAEGKCLLCRAQESKDHSPDCPRQAVLNQ